MACNLHRYVAPITSVLRAASTTSSVMTCSSLIRKIRSICTNNLWSSRKLPLVMRLMAAIACVSVRQLPRIKIPATRVLSYPFRALVLARLPKSSGGDDERTEGTAHGHHQERGPEIDRDQEKGVSSPSGFRLPQRQCSASRNRVWLVP